MKRLIQRAAAFLLCGALLCPAARAAAFPDVPEGAWYAEGAEYCREEGLLVGTGEGLFAPNQPVSRAMISMVLYRLAGSPAVAGAIPFTDVPDYEWYAACALWASQQGYMLGYNDGRFGPEDTITHEQLASVLWRWMGSPDPGPGEVPGASGYAVPALLWAGSLGLFRGVDSSAPQEPANRARLAVVLMNCFRSGGITTVSAMDVLCQPCGLAAMEDGALLVTDTYNKVLWRVKDGVSAPYAGGSTVEDLYGQPVGGYNDAGLADSYFKMPWAVAPFLDGWAVSDADNNAVRLIRTQTIETVNGRTSERLTVTELGVAFQHPTGLAADGEGNLYVSDTYANAVRKITPDGDVTTVSAKLSEPMGLWWHDGTLYIAEAGANRISRLHLQDSFLSVAAGSGTEGLADGPAYQAQFAAPQGVTVGPDGTIYVSDTNNSAIRQIKDGQVTTLAVRDVTDLQAFVPFAPTNLLLRGRTLYICDPFARKLLALPLR